MCTLLTLLVTWCALYSLYLSPGVQVADGVGNLDDALHAFDGACRTVAPDDDGAFA